MRDIQDTFVSNPETAHKFEFTLPKTDIGEDFDGFEIVLTDEENNILLQTEIPVKTETAEETAEELSDETAGDPNEDSVETIDAVPISENNGSLLHFMIAGGILVVAAVVFAIIKLMEENKNN